MHFFYLARCCDGSLYAGTAKDLKEREAKHNEGKGAKYTRSRLPVRFVYSEKFRTLPAARKREAEVKKWEKKDKEKLVRKREQRRILPARRIQGSKSSFSHREKDRG